MSLQLLSLNDQGFETSVAGYPTLSNCTTAQSAAQAHSGTNSLAMTSTGASLMSATTPVIPVMPGRSYTISGWAKAGSAVTPTAGTNLLWFQSDGATASALHATDTTTHADTNANWTQVGPGTFTAPLDAFYVKIRLQINAPAGGGEVHYFDDISFLDVSAPFFKHGIKAQILLDGKDVSSFFQAVDTSVKVDEADTTTFQATWHTAIPGLIDGSLTASGLYDPTFTDIKVDVLATTVNSVVTVAPAGATAIGDFCRLHSEVSTDYKESAKISDKVVFDWSVNSTGQVGFGECLAPLSAGSQTGTITGTGSPLLTGVSSATGAIAHLHVTATDGGSVTFKLQDSTALNGAYADITGGAFTAVTAVGGQRLVIPGTVRAYVRAVATLGAQHLTYAIAAART